MYFLFYRHPASSFGNIRRNRNYSPTYLVAKSILFCARKMLQQFVHNYNELARFLPNIKSLKNKFFHHKIVFSAKLLKNSQLKNRTTENSLPSAH